MSSRVLIDLIKFKSYKLFILRKCRKMIELTFAYLAIYLDCTCAINKIKSYVNLNTNSNTNHPEPELILSKEIESINSKYNL